MSALRNQAEQAQRSRARDLELLYETSRTLAEARLDPEAMLDALAAAWAAANEGEEGLRHGPAASSQSAGSQPLIGLSLKPTGIRCKGAAWGMAYRS